MAYGMAVSWNNFQVNGETYKSDTAFWIDSARRRIRGALNEISLHREVFTEGQYAEFIQQVQPNLQILFAELLYLNSEFLTPKQRPPNMLMKFPAHLPSLTIENVIFDEEYNIKGLISFPRTESVSSWEYFQYPYRLEESFDDLSMTRTSTWMRDNFVEAWVRTLASLGISWEGMQSREPWCQKDKVKLLYDFRMSETITPTLVHLLFSSLYHFDKSIVTVENMYDAFLSSTCSLLYNYPTAWESKPDMYIEMSAWLLALATGQIHDLSRDGECLREGHSNFKIIQLPNFSRLVP
jgi:hypothetical protein